MPKTVFIVGAGASSEFGFPLGVSLVNEIRNRLEEEIRSGVNELRPLIYGAMELGLAGDWGDAAREVAAGMISARSIDRFIHTRWDKPLVVALGKFAISHLIAEREKGCLLSLQQGDRWANIQEALVGASNSWIARLFSLLQEGKRPDQADEVFSDISFITFNYDRVIERYLQLAFQHTFRLDPKAAEDVVASVPIEHVYGSLGKLGGQDRSARTFGLMYENPRDSLDHFVTFTEGVEDGRLSRIRAIIREANLLVFLGFSFDKLNVDALLDEPIQKSKMVLATTYGMGDYSVEQARMGLSVHPSYWRSAPMTCEGLIGSELFNSTFWPTRQN